MAHVRPFELEMVVDSSLLPNLSLSSSSSSPDQLLQSAHLCSSRLLHLSLWFLAVLDVVIALLALPFNALLTASALVARPMPYPIRRSMSMIAVGYAFLAGVLFAKKAFWLSSALSAESPCVPLVTSIGCKLQEFPVLVVYLHALGCPLAFTVGMYGERMSTNWREKRGGGGKGLDNQRNRNRCRKHSITNNNVKTDGFVPAPPLSASSHPRRSSSALPAASPPPACPLFWVCSSRQIALIVACMALAFLFTAFDQEPARRKVLINCTLPLAIRQKELLFVLLTLVLGSQLLQTLLWQSIPASDHSKGNLTRSTRYSEAASDRPPSSLITSDRSPSSLITFDRSSGSLITYLILSLRDLFLVESILWALVSFFTGFVLLHQFVITKPCGKCTRLMVELSFTTLPLLISLLHPILSVLIIAPISYSAQRLCPILGTVLPAQPPATPPLPRAVPTVRILITEH